MTALGWLLSSDGWNLVRNRCDFAAAPPHVHLEPNPVIVIMCCARSQRKKYGMSEKVIAALQRKNLPFRNLIGSGPMIASVQNLAK
ncbi:hypothetical protein [Tritonibacter sp. SIMBA_163]|uniref:hypothetical protein n=1 Tax=Tritonibacter sp. SIMBA_163 TaxID=3080868 RepID=UPI00397F484A